MPSGRPQPRHRYGAPTHDTGTIQPPAPAHVLLIARAGYADALQRALPADRAELATAHSLSSGLAALSTDQFDAAVVDLDLPGAVEQVGRVREAARGAALVLVGDAGEVAADADECVSAEESPEAVARCITAAVQRRRLEAALEASEMRFRSIIERTDDGIIIVDDDRRVRFVNAAAERLFRRDASALLGEDFGMPVVSGERTEMDIVRKGGDAVVAELRVSQTTWEGEPAQVITLHDITDRRAAEEQQRRLLLERAARSQAEKAGSRASFLAAAATALDASLDPAHTLTNLAQLAVPRLADWCVVDLLEDARIERVAGVHAEQAKQTLLDELRQRFPPRLGSPQPSARVMASGEPELHRNLDQRRLRALSVSDEHAELLERLGVKSSMTVPLQARGRQLGAMTFVCGQRSFDREDLQLAIELGTRAANALDNARLYEAAVAANRAKRDFLAVMSHELRTPLNAVLGYTQLLLEGISGEVADTQRRQLERIDSSARHLLNVINEILAFASMEAGREDAQAQPVRVGALVDEIVAITKPLVREQGLQFTHDVTARDSVIHTDGAKLRQIALNLLTNAVKFTEEGSITLRAAVEDDWFVLEVSDTGIGIAPEAVDRIFEPFNQLQGPMTRSAGGTGLGLSVSQRLAALLGGAISVRSEPGSGSTFTLRIPTTPADAPGMARGRKTRRTR